MISYGILVFWRCCIETVIVNLNGYSETDYTVWMPEKKEKVLRSSIVQIKEMQEIFVKWMTAAMEGDKQKGEAWVQQYREKMPEACIGVCDAYGGMFV